MAEPTSEYCRHADCTEPTLTQGVCYDHATLCRVDGCKQPSAAGCCELHAELKELEHAWTAFAEDVPMNEEVWANIALQQLFGELSTAQWCWLGTIASRVASLKADLAVLNEEDEG